MSCELVLPHVPADPLEVAGRLAAAPGLAVLLDSTGQGASFVACRPIAESRELDPEPGLPLAPAAPHGPAVPRWIGVMPYECRRELERGHGREHELRAAPAIQTPIWRRYAAVARIERGEVRLYGDDADAVASLATELERSPAAERGPAWLEPWGTPEPEARHVERIRAALELIGAGELYQVNLARRFLFRLHGGRLDLLAQLAERAPTPFAAWLELGDAAAISTSPESFLELSAAGELRTSPIKGTRPRFADPVADAEAARELDRDPKERAELTMILDVERNDLGRVCRPGTVRLAAPPAVHAFGPVHHRVATLSGELRSDVSRSELFRAMCPSGSVTGAPKVRAMDLIAELEPERRGLYTGAYGALMHDGTFKLAMAIRCLTLVGDQAHYFSGGGIVADSDPEREVLETRWKARQLGAFPAERKEEAWVWNKSFAHG